MNESATHTSNRELKNIFFFYLLLNIMHDDVTSQHFKLLTSLLSCSTIFLQAYKSQLCT